MKGWHFRTCKKCGKYYYTRASSGGYCPECLIVPERSLAVTVDEYKKLKKEYAKKERKKFQTYY